MIMLSGSNPKASLKICVVGAGGAIGSRLVAALIDEGHQVTAIVRRLQTAVRIARFPVSMHQLDLAQATSKRLTPLLAGHDVVVDCTYSSQSEPQAAVAESQRMAQTLVDACLAAKVSKLVHFGTISVYPTTADTINESTICEFQGSAYGDGKLAAERVLLNSSLHVIVLQLPVVLGPFLGWTKNLAAQLGGATLTLPNDIAGRCDPLYIDDVVTATQKAIALLLSQRGAVRDRFLLPGFDNVSWNDVYRAHADALGSANLDAISRDQFDKLRADQQRNQKPWIRLKRVFQQDGDFRQLVLAQWGVRSVYRVLKQRRGQAGMDQIKNRLARSLDSEQPGHRQLLSPSLLQTFDTMPAISSDKALKHLDFKASTSLSEITRISSEWLHWSGLAE